MPTTFVGLCLFAAILLPGFLSYLQRRALAPQRQLSPLVETATIATVSMATNAVALLLFGLVRVFIPEVTPDIQRLVEEGSTYASPRLASLGGWAAALLTVSSAIAVVLARWPFWRRWFTPVIVDTSAWYFVFQEQPDRARAYVGCDMADGTYVSGFLLWYSTEVEETADRDLVIATPKIDPDPGLKPSRVVISARNILRLYLWWIDPEEDDVEATS